MKNDIRWAPCALNRAVEGQKTSETWSETTFSLPNGDDFTCFCPHNQLYVYRDEEGAFKKVLSRENEGSWKLGVDYYVLAGYTDHEGNKVR